MTKLKHKLITFGIDLQIIDNKVIMFMFMFMCALFRFGVI